MTENNTPTPTASIELLGKTYQIKCPENEVAALQKAAAFLNSTLKSMPQVGRPLAPDKMGIMAALNLASRILELEEQMSQHMHFLNLRLQHLLHKLENSLSSQEFGPSFRLEVESVQN